jgi:predicted RNA-binding protein
MFRRAVNTWCLVGNEENWRAAFRQGAIWGIRAKYRSLWERLRPGDRLIFYCKSPIAGAIGVGKLAKAFKQDTPFWPDEERAQTVIYPYRFEMNIVFLLPETQWRTHAIKGHELGLSRGYVAKGLNPIRDLQMLTAIDAVLKTKFGVTRLAEEKVEQGPELSTHSGVQEMLVQLGMLQRFLSHKEFPMEHERLDVVWRRVEGSVPTYVFEVQVGGDVHHALGKLKHAHDIWNSNLFLVLADGDVPKAQSYLSGTFHEVKDRVKLVRLEEVQELYALKKQWKLREEALGIL